ncbi:MAG TPA: hypothetical protein P5080_05510 [Candidatus Paceibacterota bacterium]|nr:hypothetical protein [Candidatus Pacearchaeota archaeon]HRZ51403.1 hypothetical protein [Candidatus Paceibacterota bacterium]HSA37125.1 hypothetical protein [Candidatus Paceibacterota bacterium]
MALFVEKRRNKAMPRVYPLAVIKGEILGITIRVEEPVEFKEEYPFVFAAFFQELAPGLNAEAMMLPEGNDPALDLLEIEGDMAGLLLKHEKRGSR